MSRFAASKYKNTAGKEAKREVRTHSYSIRPVLFLTDNIYVLQQWYSELTCGGSNADGTPIAASATFIAYAMHSTGGGNVGLVRLDQVCQANVLFMRHTC